MKGEWKFRGSRKGEGVQVEGGAGHRQRIVGSRMQLEGRARWQGGGQASARIANGCK